jgi:hypothetical protein
MRNAIRIMLVRTNLFHVVAAIGLLFVAVETSVAQTPTSDG